MQSLISLPIVIPCEDELVHFDERPICDDPECPCHEEQEVVCLVNGDEVEPLAYPF